MSTVSIPGHRQLAAWLKQHGHTHAWLAQAIGVSYTAAASWINGTAAPQPQYRVAIFRLTEIEMPAAKVGRPRNPTAESTIPDRHVPLAPSTAPEAQADLSSHLRTLATLPDAIGQLTSTNRDLVAVLELLVQSLASAERDTRSTGAGT
jgi:hypothetical protein